MYIVYCVKTWLQTQTVIAQAGDSEEAHSLSQVHLATHAPSWGLLEATLRCLIKACLVSKVMCVRQLVPDKSSHLGEPVTNVANRNMSAEFSFYAYQYRFYGRLKEKEKNTSFDLEFAFVTSGYNFKLS